MKIHRSAPAFAPVVITIETYEELVGLRRAVDIVGRNSLSNLGIHNVTTEAITVSQNLYRHLSEIQNGTIQRTQQY